MSFLLPGKFTSNARDNESLKYKVIFNQGLGSIVEAFLTEE